MKILGSAGLVLASITATLLLFTMTGCLLDALAYDEEEEECDYLCRLEDSTGIVEFRSDGELAFAAFRGGDDATWKTQRDVLGRKSFSHFVSGSYTVMIVCVAPSGPTTVFHSGAAYPGSAGRSPVINLSCLRAAPPPFVVRGTMVEPGTVTLGKQRVSSSQPGWTFELPVAAGTYDLVASGGATGSERALVQRAIVVSASMTLPAIELAQQGTALRPVQPMSIQNPVAGETASAQSSLRTAATTGELYRGAFPAKILPDAPAGELEVGVRSELHTANLFIERVTRRLYNPYNPADVGVPFMLWNPFRTLEMRSTERGDLQLAWQADNSFLLQPFQVTARDEQGRTIIYSAEAGRFADLQGIALDTSAPDYQAAWRIDPAQPHTVTLEMSGKNMRGDSHTLTIKQLRSHGPIISQ